MDEQEFDKSMAGVVVHDPPHGTPSNDIWICIEVMHGGRRIAYWRSAACYRDSLGFIVPPAVHDFIDPTQIPRPGTVTSAELNEAIDTAALIKCYLTQKSERRCEDGSRRMVWTYETVN